MLSFFIWLCRKIAITDEFVIAGGLIYFDFVVTMAQIRDEILLQKIALKLKKLREKKKLSQAQLTHETDIHIARLETGKVNISISTLSKLCEYFDITLAEFFKKI